MCAVRVGEDLDLDVTRPLDQTLDVQGAVAERGLGFAAGCGRARRPPHPACARLFMPMPPPPADGLIKAGNPTRSIAARERRIGLIGRRFAGHDRHAGRDHQSPRADLRAHLFERGGGRADEDQAGVFARACEVGAFREKAVAGMNCLRAGGLCRRDDLRGVEVTLARRRGANGARPRRLRARGGAPASASE